MQTTFVQYLKGRLSPGRMRQSRESRLLKCSAKSKMASTSGGGHGGKRRNSGRKVIFETPTRAKKVW